MRVVPLIVIVLALAACDSPRPETPTPTPSPSATLEPGPLRLPVLAPGAACPVTRPQPWSGPGETDTVLGAGPVYPVAYYFRAGTVLELRPDDRAPDGSYVKKVRWIGAGYIGPVLIRAGRVDGKGVDGKGVDGKGVDGKGSASARFSYRGAARDGGWYAELTTAESDLPATTTVSGPGCYAYQVDGIGFTRTIVFRAA